MKIGGRFITLSFGASSSVLYLEDGDITTDTEFLTRPEYDHNKRKTAPEATTGAVPSFGGALDGTPYQVIYGSATTARDLSPHSSTSLSEIYRKFVITRYTFKGGVVTSADAQIAYDIWKYCRILLDRYEAHKQHANDSGTSYQQLGTLQGQTFTFLTTTGITMTGLVTGTVNNILLRQFDLQIDRYVSGSNAKLLYKWTGIAENWVYKAADALS